MTRIFISYRRDDSAESATILHDRLQLRFKPENVFLDVEDVRPGDAFPQKIREELESAEVVLAVIGPKWLDVVDEKGDRRLDKEDDYVAIELSMALQLEKPVIPVLVGDAKPPPADALPPRLRRLSALSAHAVSPKRINPDVTELIGFIEQMTPEAIEGATTFLFTDIEASSTKWEQYLEGMRVALERHDEIIEAAVRDHGGDIFAELGDGVSTAFHSPIAAVRASIDGQRALQDEPWDTVGGLAVRMAIHTGAPQRRHGNYYGPTLNRTARLLELANGGQIVLSGATYELVHDRLPRDAALLDRGTHPLRSLTRPEHVYQLTHTKLDRVDTPLRVGVSTKRRIPLHLPRFIGRERELERARQLLSGSRLVTLTGVGGTGKTRLAYAVAASYEEADYADGIAVVKLEGVKLDAHVVKAVAQELGVRERPGSEMLDVIVEELGDRRLLLFIDNCEHVIEACAMVVSQILEWCPNVAILATSREALRVPGEITYLVPGLTVPSDADAPPDVLAAEESIALFVDRAMAANPSFELTAVNAPHVAALCAYLDGIPLAIELAASRSNALTPAQLREELKHPLRVLRGGPRTAEKRHKTIEETIRWSVDLLTPEETSVFYRLSVLEGEFTMEAARALISSEDSNLSVLDAVNQLVAKSLLLPGEGHDGLARYRMLATLREFGRQQLDAAGEWNDLGRLAAEYFLEVAERFAPDLQGADQQHARDELELEHANLRAAIEWAIANRNRRIAGRLAVALRWFWYWGGHIEEGHDFMDRVLDVLSGERDLLRGYVSMGAGILTDVYGQLEKANTQLGLALQLGRELEDETLVARTLAALGVVAKDHGWLAEAAQRFDESIAIDQTLGEDVDYEIALRFAGEVAYLRGDFDAATRLLDEAYSAADRIGRSGELAWISTHMGELLRRRERTADARIKLEEAAGLHQAIEYPRGVAWSEMFLGMAERDAGRADVAERVLNDALRAFRSVPDHRGIPYALLALAGLARQGGAFEEAQQLVSEARRAGEAIGDRRAVAWSTMENASIVWAMGEPDHDMLEAALVEFGEIEDRSGAHAALRLAGRVMVDEGDIGQGVVLLGAAAAVPGAPRGERLPAEVAGARAAVHVGFDGNAKWEEGLELDVESALALAVDALAHHAE